MICIRKLFFAAGAAAITAGVYSSATFAATVTANADARVIAPLVVTQTAGMNFGDLSVGGTGGTLLIDTAGTLTPSADVDTAGGTVQAGAYGVAGEAGKAYTVSFPANATLTSGGNTMTVDTFTENSAASPTVPATFNVGGTLNVGANQPAGLYQGTYTITVNYQ